MTISRSAAALLRHGAVAGAVVPATVASCWRAARLLLHRMAIMV